MIKFYNEECKKPKLPYLVLKKWIVYIIKKNGFINGDISFIFCNNDYILNINIDFLKHDYYTDIITFNYNESSLIAGDIFISLDMVKENAKLFNCTFEKELLRVIIHGILHLIGFDDTTEELQKIMTQKEDEALELYSNKFSNK